MKKRMDYLDVAKGIAMFLVVMGHAALAYDTPYWRVAIYSFHMPLFYLVHLPIIRFFIAPKLHELGLDRLSVHGALIDAVLTMIVCCAIIWVIQKYIPALFGRFGGLKGASVVANTVASVVGEAPHDLDETAAKETLKAFVACAVKDGKVDFDETLALLRAVEPLAARCGGAYAAFRDLLIETRADGVITPEESDELCAILRRFT